MRYAAMLASALLASPLLVLTSCSSKEPASANGASKEDDSESGRAPSKDSPANTADASTPSGEGTPPGAPPSKGEMLLAFFDRTMHGGVDGTHPYQLAGFVVTGDPTGEKTEEGGVVYTDLPFEPPPEITISDPNVATLKAIPRPQRPPPDFFPTAQWFTLDTKAAGQATLEVKYKGKTAKANVIVTQYTAAQWELGKTRYTAPANASATRKACSECHAQRDKMVAPSHGAFFQSYLSDEQLLSGIKTGKIGDRTFKVEGGHTWELTADEEKGILAYLRSLNPFGTP